MSQTASTEQTMSVEQKASGMLLLRGEAVRSLATCSVNLHPSCDLHMAQKRQEYLKAWQNPAPPHCATPRHDKATDPVMMNRLGINLQALCEGGHA